MPTKRVKVKRPKKEGVRKSARVSAPIVRGFLVFLFLLSPFSLPVRGQTVTVDEAIRIDTDLVDLNVSVLGRDPSRPIGQLQQNDFAVFENGEAQEIKFFASAAAPLDLVLLLDLSGSTAGKLKLIRTSTQRFVDAARPTDRIGVVTFTDRPAIVSLLTDDRSELKARVKKIGKPMGGTKFWDALRFVLETMLGQTKASRRSAVVVMTDGVDNALPGVAGEGSRTTFGELLEMIRRSETIVFPIYLDTEPEEVRLHRTPASAYFFARQQLAQIAAESGSIVYKAGRLEDLRGVYEQVIRDLGTIYSIGYCPNNRKRDGAWRAVSVQFVGHPDLIARTKRGYYAK